MTICRAVFAEDGDAQQDGHPEHIIGDPKELILEVGVYVLLFIFVHEVSTGKLGPGQHFPVAHFQYSREESSFSPIRALVTYKSELDVKIAVAGDASFIIHLLDETGEVRAQASSGIARELYDRFEEGKVYYVYNTRVAFTGYSPYYNLMHSFKLILSRRTVIEEVS